jgi:DNA-binding response OmpR family regulator
VSSHLILIAEENDSTRAFLADQLAADGYQTVVADSRLHALHQLATHRPQLVLADLNGQTLGLLDAVRRGEGPAGEIDPHTPMIVLTTTGGGELERVRVFDRGGDDVISKPFSYPELRGRVRALLRRACEPRPARVSRVGALTVDHLAREVRIADRVVDLAAKEYALLRALITDPTRVRTREELLRAVWGLSAEARTRTLDSHAFRLRKKLAAADPGLRLVINVWGVGYRLCDREVRR